MACLCLDLDHLWSYVSLRVNYEILIYRKTYSLLNLRFFKLHLFLPAFLMPAYVYS